MLTHVSYPIPILSPFRFYHPYNYSLYYKFFLFTCIKISIDAKRQHVCKQHKQPLGITGSGFRLHDLNCDFNGMGSHWAS